MRRVRCKLTHFFLTFVLTICLLLPLFFLPSLHDLFLAVIRPKDFSQLDSKHLDTDPSADSQLSNLRQRLNAYGDGSPRHQTNSLVGKKPQHSETELLKNNTSADLKEFLSAHTESRRFNELLLKAEDRAPPPLTAANCTELVRSPNSSLHDASLHGNATGNIGAKPWRIRELLEKTQNCMDFLLSSGFRFAQVSEEELSFPLAFSILAYKDLEQVERLLRAVYRPHNVYCLHADRKAPEDFHNGLRRLATCLPSVVVVQHSVDVRWGTISVLEPDMLCMRQLFAHRTSWRYFINLTGQEFPLKTNREMVRILSSLKGANIISGTTDKSFEFRWKSNPKPVPYNLTMYKGDVHIIASRGYVDYVINSQVARDLYEWLKDTLIPDESFFSTLNYNPQLGVPGSYIGLEDTNVNHTFRSLKLWIFNPTQGHCHGKWVRWICHFGVGDLPALTSSHFLIANKFSYDYQPLAYNCLEKWYFDKVGRENDGVDWPLNMSLYEKSAMVLHRYTGPVLMWG